MSNNPWWVCRRCQRGDKMDIQVKQVNSYDEAVSVAKKWYKRYRIGYGIAIKYMIDEIGELAEVRFYHLVNSEEDIK